jgi:hypothetical protein
VQNRNKLFRAYFLFLFLLSFNVCSQDLSREVSVSFQNWPLEKALTYLTQNHGLLFSYSSEIVSSRRLISLDSKKLALKIILEEILDQTDLEYEFIGRQIVLRRKSRKPDIEVSIEGVVVDATTNSLLPGASVFFNNSSKGQFADAEGKFVFNNISIDNNELVVSYLGYKTLIAKLNLKPDVHPRLLIKLLPDTVALAEVIIAATRDAEWLKNFELFNNEFLGQTPTAKLCRILNPSVLRFNNKDGKLFIRANEPIRIENQALGYWISVSIENGIIDPKDKYAFIFYTRFDPMEPADDRQKIRWEVNRLRSYLGSQKHLFKSLIGHNSYHQGFDIFQNPTTELSLEGNEVKAKSVFSAPFEKTKVTPEGLEGDVIRVFEKGKYLIKYVNSLIPNRLQVIADSPYPTTIIEVKSDVLLVNGNGGVLSKLSNFEREGYMDTHRIADELPNEFDPLKTQRTISEYLRSKLGNIEGMVLDSVTREPIAGAEVFINNSTIHTKTSKEGRYFLKDIPLGIHDLFVSSASRSMMRHHSVASQNKNHVDTVLLSLNKNKFIADNTATTADRNLYLASFRHQLIGKSHSSETRIENEYAIRINEEENGNRSYAVHEPLEIINKKTRYKVKFFLQNAALNTKSKNVLIEGGCYFESLDTLFQNTSIEIKRLDAYEGSLLNFSRTLLHTRTKEEGFSLFVMKDSTASTQNKYPSRMKKKNEVELLPEELTFIEGKAGTTILLPRRFEVRHTLPNLQAKKSTVILKGKGITISGFGSLSLNREIEIIGAMKEVALIPKLPIDYTLPKKRPLHQF